MRRIAAVGVILVLLLLTVSLADGGGPTEPAPSGDSTVELVPVENNNSLWPYTSKGRVHASRTLAMNVLVGEDPETVARILRGLPERDWQPTNESVEEPNVSVDTGDEVVELQWQDAHGSTRYTYVDWNGVGRWLSEYDQLHEGWYLLERDHVRIYAVDDGGDWTALQVHQEYWDWFRLRHTVTDVSASRDRLVDELTDRSYRVTRLIEGDGRHSGPLTVLERGTVLGILLGVATTRRRLEEIVDRVGTELDRSPGLSMAAFVFAVPLAVRSAGVLGELLIAPHSPKFVAAVLYPFLVLGLPVGVFLLARNTRPLRAFPLVATAFLLAVGVDFAIVGARPPPGVVFDRTLLAAGLATLAAAAGADRRRRWVLVAGVVIWCLGVIVPLDVGIP